jgi:23S rRNA pseudouridine1911/1915/1917 synthase
LNKKFVQKLVLNKAESSERLDLILSKKLSISRSQAQKLIKEGLADVKDGAVSIYELEKSTSRPNIPIIYEDKDILVIDKPAGITAHPAPGEKEITVAEIFEKAIVVHRLDKGTSGVMVLAKNQKAAESLKGQFQARKVAKKYIALIHGKLLPDEGVIDMPLSRNLIARNKIAPAEEGRDAKTLYKVLKYYRGFTLVEAKPKTGRTHQIRVHFSAIGFPLFGDARYGNSADKTDRVFLHAAELSFLHPTTGERVTYISKLPLELEKVLHTLGD